ncbi:YheV family putative metal-binding protein [Photobacterium carnosum]|uniref:Metal-binding protein n=1 Tax=Photobacterium carnosum TaxID=2023717 RepID=A0A2N4UUC1_9GAMM|nr:YheV family putative zinc ribbon protein [Photobacterium carnosum]KAE8176909.1 metal-binding protein [Photobacterium carnosum]MBY3788369.1 YheV family putative metal-binding protein [Photobacterium carnosum]MCD9494734.1 YheV family putative metal-binding protein [Photobacterium carnosum]MCD9499520.1 YheV family putative metal-binding protein [Photobacterium carnosum]MCD9514540.1 YheV family putative metal-binding protein [Photobacterium carnosum]
MVKKRFIAGAICPNCQALDTLRWWQQHDVEHIECVQCQHIDTRLPQAVKESEQLSSITKQQVIGIFKPE